MTPAVYVQTNDATDNEVVAFSRSEDGSLSRWAATARAGAGPARRTFPRRARSSSATTAAGCWW